MGVPNPVTGSHPGVAFQLAWDTNGASAAGQAAINNMRKAVGVAGVQLRVEEAKRRLALS